jgi:hypothetical protein
MSSFLTSIYDVSGRYFFQLSCEVSKNFRNKKRKYLKGNSKERAINSKTKNVRVVVILDIIHCPVFV